MSALPVSVVVVSRGRPEALRRCLTGLSQQFYSNFEIIVVADEGGFASANAAGFADNLKIILFDDVNISAARNAGIAAAAGDVVAFIDDDAVPEPTWLVHLCAPFDVSNVAAAGGFVLGRNGISFQWTAQSVDNHAVATDLKVDAVRPTVLTPANGQAIKTEGTNMAFRRDILADLGGFDPAYRYYLDETDLNLRLAQRGMATAVVPLAQVHHGYLPNAQRRMNRAPKDLFEIGASLQVFLRKHCPVEDHARLLADFRRGQRKRALRFMNDGLIEPRDVRRLLGSLQKGFDAGANRILGSLPMIVRPAEGFRKFPLVKAIKSTALSGRSWQRKKMRQQARDLVASGENVTVFLFSPTARFHQMRFCNDGFWEQRGGLFGRSVRTQPLLQFKSFGHRVRVEKQRIFEQRPLSDT